MTRRDVQELLELIRRYGDGDRTKALAADIEGLVIECFQDEPWFEEVSEALALFVPGGSTPHIDADQLARELAPVAAILTSCQSTWTLSERMRCDASPLGPVGAKAAVKTL